MNKAKEKQLMTVIRAARFNKHHENDIRHAILYAMTTANEYHTLKLNAALNAFERLMDQAKKRSELVPPDQA